MAFPFPVTAPLPPQSRLPWLLSSCGLSCLSYAGRSLCWRSFYIPSCGCSCCLSALWESPFTEFLVFSAPFSCSRSGSSAVLGPFEAVASRRPGNSGVKRRKTSVFTHLRLLPRFFSYHLRTPILCGKPCGNCKPFISYRFASFS